MLLLVIASNNSRYRNDNFTKQTVPMTVLKYYKSIISTASCSYNAHFFYPNGLAKTGRGELYTGLIFCKFIITFCSLQMHQNHCVAIE